MAESPPSADVGWSMSYRRFSPSAGYQLRKPPLSVGCPVVQSQPIRTYTANKMSFYKESHPLAEDVDEAIEWLGDVSLKAELTHWRSEGERLDCIIFEMEQLDTEKWKLQMSHAGTTHRLSGAKFDDRVKRANHGKVGDLIAEYKRRRGSSTVKRG